MCKRERKKRKRDREKKTGTQAVFWKPSGECLPKSTSDGEYWWVGRAGGQVSWRASLMTFRYSNSTLGTSEKPYALSWLEPWWDLYETFIHVPSSLTWVLLKEPPSPVCRLRRPCPSPCLTCRTPHHLPFCRSYHAPPPPPASWLATDLGRKFRILTTALFGFSSSLSCCLYSLLTLRPQSRWLGSMSPAEAWLLSPTSPPQRGPPDCSTAFAYPLLSQALPWSLLWAAQSASVCSDSVHSSAACLPILTTHSASLVRSSALETRPSTVLGPRAPSARELCLSGGVQVKLNL